MRGGRVLHHIGIVGSFAAAPRSDGRRRATKYERPGLSCRDRAPESRSRGPAGFSYVPRYADFRSTSGCDRGGC
jgi:hypothetical protein